MYLQTKMPALELGRFRAWYCAAILIATLIRFTQYGVWIGAGVIQSKYPYYYLEFLSEPVWWWARLIFWIGLTMATLNFFTRVGLACAVTSLFVLAMPIHPPLFDTSVIFFVLLILLFSPGIHEHSWLKKKDSSLEIPEWPREAIVLYLVSSYIGAALNKLVHRGGLEWLSGTTLRLHLYRFAEFAGLKTSVLIAEQAWLCRLLTLGIIGLEVTFALVIFFPRVRRYYAVAGLAMHVSIYALMRIEFMLLFTPVYLIFFLSQPRPRV